MEAMVGFTAGEVEVEALRWMVLETLAQAVQVRRASSLSPPISK
jgi:hypothetical protein